jgi:hypothetical protein
MSTRAQRGDRGTRGAALAGSTHNKTSNDNTNNNGRRHHQSRGVSRWELDSNVQWGVAENDGGAKLAVPEKTALVTKWVKVAKREEEKEDAEAEAEEKKFEAIKRVPYGTKSTTKETTE